MKRLVLLTAAIATSALAAVACFDHPASSIAQTLPDGGSAANSGNGDPAYWTPPQPTSSAQHNVPGGGGTSGATTTNPPSGSSSGGGGPSGPAPAIGAHRLGFHRHQVNQAPLVLPAMNTAASGSTIVVGIGRGAIAAFSSNASDNKNNGAFPQLGTAHTYALWNTSGTGLFAATNVAGGSGHVITVQTPANDEVTAGAVEVLHGKVIHDFKWSEVLVANHPVKSQSVTTTAPAVLIAYWWGDGGADGNKVAVPNNGFTVLDSIGEYGNLVQCFVAAKVAPTPGTYDVTWTSTPAQGAQLWLVAVQ